MNTHRNQLTGFKQGGFGLVEAMMVTSILVFGFVAGTKTQANLIQTKAISNQNFQANQLSNQKLEQLRNYQDLTAYSNIGSGTDTTSGADTTYTRAWAVTTNNKYKLVNQTISWTTSGNESISIGLSTYIAQNDPKQSGGIFNASYATTPLPSIGSGTPGYQAPPDPNLPPSTTDVTIPGTNIVVTYDQNNNVVAINNGAAVTISGTVSLGEAGFAPPNTVTLSTVTVNPNSSNSIVNTCSYINTTGSYSCIMGHNWSGTIHLGGISDAKVCANAAQPYTNVLTSLNHQSFLIIKSTKSCPSAYSILLQTL